MTAVMSIRAATSTTIILRSRSAASVQHKCKHKNKDRIRAGIAKQWLNGFEGCCVSGTWGDKLGDAKHALLDLHCQLLCGLALEGKVSTQHCKHEHSEAPDVGLACIVHSARANLGRCFHHTPQKNYETSWTM